MGRRADRKKEGNSQNYSISKILLITLTIFISIFLVGYLIYKKNHSEMIKAVDIDTIYNGVKVAGIDVSGKTEEEAIEFLRNELEAPLAAQTIDIVDNDRRYQYTFSDFNVRYDIEASAQKAFEAGRLGDIKDRYKEIKSFSEKGFNIEPEYYYDTGKVEEVLNALKPEFDVPAINSKLTKSNGVFSATDEKNGYQLDIGKTAEKINLQLSTKQSGEIIAETSVLEPKITKEQNMKATTLIGSYTTSFTNGAGSEGRNENLRLACASINGTLLAPGEIFSMNKTLGPQTYANGYKDAGIYVNGKVEQGVGGGVCQVTTTLYNAVIKSEIDIVERSNHSLTVAYVPMGMDAAIAGDYKDLKFKNTTDYPIYLEAYITSNQIVTNIYGYEIHGDGHKVEYETEYVGSIPKPAEKITKDPNLPEGERIVTYTGKVGHKVNTYKVVYENGKQVSRKLFNTSTYRATADEVTIGTKKIESQTQPPASENLEPIT